MREIHPIGFRAPPEIRALLKAAAASAGRSLNAQMLVYMQQGLRLDGFEVPRHEKGNARAALTARAFGV